MRSKMHWHFLALFAAGCTQSADTATRMMAPSELSAAKATGSTATNPTADFAFPLVDAAMGLRSDHNFVTGDNSMYVDGVCGVVSSIMLSSGTYDARMQTDSRIDRKCVYSPRKLTIDYGDGQVLNGGTVVNVLGLGRPDLQTAIGGKSMRGMNVQDVRCATSTGGGLRWHPNLIDGTVVAADSVIVTRLDSLTYLVETQPYPNDRAYCAGNGASYHIPVRFTVKSSKAL